MISWSEDAKAYPLESVCKATDMPPYAVEPAVRWYKEQAENLASKTGEPVQVKHLREVMAKYIRDRYKDTYPTMDAAYKRLEELETQVGYTTSG